MVSKRILNHTLSVCPVCLKQVPGEHILINKDIYLQKQCKEHGLFSTIIWRGHIDIDEWLFGIKEKENNHKINADCPKACGLCSSHIQDTCCVLLSVTNQCNLKCRFCFAENDENEEPSYEQICKWIKQLTEPGKTLLQLSGGEPTLREDLPQIVAAAKAAGCKYVQLNTNGIRLAEDKDYLRLLAEAGLSFVFMQFDGTEDAIYQRLRGKSLLEIKQQVIKNCDEYNLGVTLVPTVVPGVNTHNIGDIIRFAISHSPAVRGVHFQPVSYFGRIPSLPEDGMRFTLDELFYQIQQQAGELIKPENILPSCCDHPLCGFHGDFIVMQNKLIPLSHRRKVKKERFIRPVPLSEPKFSTEFVRDSATKPSPAEKNRSFVARRWQREEPLEEQTENETSYGELEPNIKDMGYFLKRIKSHGFTITSMAFQDAGNIDLKRLQRCSLHVFDNGKFVPFCAYYLSGW